MMTMEEQMRAWIREEIAAASLPVVDLTLKEFAALFDRHEETVRQWCVSGKVPGAYQLVDREWRIPAASVEKFQRHERLRWKNRGKYAASGQR